MAPPYFFVFFLLSHLVLLHSAEEEKCLPFYCGKPEEKPITNLRECGWVTVGNCTVGVPILPKFQLDQGGGKWFNVVGISQADTIAIHDTLFPEYLQNCHCKSSENWILPSSLPISINFTTDKALSKCNHALNTTPHKYFSYIGCDICHIYHHYQPHRCSIIHPPINMNYTYNDNLLSLLAADIFLVVQVSEDCHKCYYKGDECKSDDNGKVQCPNTAEEEKCPPFYRGNPKENGFQYSANLSECGWVTVGNCIEAVPKIQLDQGGGNWLDVVGISQADTIAIHDPPFLEHLQDCKCASSDNWTLPSSPSISFKFTTDKALSRCNHDLSTTPPTYFSYIGCNFCGYQPSLPPQCSSIHPPINMNYTNNDLLSLLAADIFLVVQLSEYCSKCYYKGGECKSDDNGKVQCPNTGIGNKKLGLKLALGITVASAAGIGVLMFIVCCFWRKSSSNKSMAFWKKETHSHQNVEVFLRNYGSLTPKRYSYSDVKKMTYSFKDKLGQGGFGGVYKGKLHDGRLVAVKVLNKSKGDGQDFVNEVASISRTSHVNIVTLLGFCFEGSKRALIYEFVPNGSLEKFIYEKNTLKANRQLGWETLYQIAIGIARGLEYLHRGCNIRILHFDIKPHNILLDEDFCPKISDFGLAKLCPNRESIISMLGARGTAGYIAPEVFCRHFGGVSHKSDVYSYGMMVLEMVGGRKNIDVGVDHTSEIYFPHWIYKRLEQADELGLHGVMNEEENEKARKMILVGLWCIQTDPSNRPPIGRVVEMLQGSLGSLQIPPCPFLSSPPRSPADSLTSPIMTS